MQKRACPSCSAENYATDAVCMSCGADMAARGQAPSHPPEPEKEPQAAPPERNWGFAIAAIFMGFFCLFSLLGALTGCGRVTLTLGGASVVSPGASAVVRWLFVAFTGWMAYYFHKRSHR